MINGHIETIFCDDVRREEGGKLTLVGVYSDILIVPKFPIILPKMCLWVKLITFSTVPPRYINLYVMKGDESSREFIIDKQQWVASPDLDENTKNEQIHKIVHTMQVILAFSPMQFDYPCTLRVRAHTEEGDLYGLTLQVGKSL